MSGLVLEGLDVAYRGGAGEVQALRDISLAIAPGEMLGLVGESGSGKSTVAHALMGLLPPDARVLAGEARLDGARLDLTRPDLLARFRGRSMAMVFQDPLQSLNPVFTIAAHLAEALRHREGGLSRRARRARMEAALAAVGMSEPGRRLGQYPLELSGGMRQRAVIAMALLARPRLLIADEPTTALDATVEAQVMAAIRLLRDEIGCAVLLITHSLGLVAQHCDSVTVLYAGERLESGPVAAVTRRPGHPYSERLLECEVGLDAIRAEPATGNRFRVIPGALPDPQAPRRGCVFLPRCDRAIAACAVTAPGDRPAGPDPGHVARCHLLPEGPA